MIKRIVFSLILVSSLLVSVPAVFAHTVLIKSDPVANSTITELPEEVSLTFADPLLVLGKIATNSVEVIDPMGEVITSNFNVVKGAVLTNVVAPKMLMLGKYKVEFRVVAQDGHVVTGNFFFNVGSSSSSGVQSLPKLTGIFHITATANGAGVMDGVGSASQSAKLDLLLNFTNKTACSLITTKIPDVTAAHIHAMSEQNMTISDEIFIPLNLKSLNSKLPDCEPVPEQTLTTLYENLSHYMFMLHTKSFPDGAVGGPLKVSTSKTPLASASPIKQPPNSFGTAITESIPQSVLLAKFVDQSGKVHSLRELKGKTAILVPVLTLCGDSCPFTTANMLQLQQKLIDAHADNVKVIGIDVDPYRDNVARLKAYSNIIDANFELWTAVGATTRPTFTKAELAMKDPIGTGDINSNLQEIVKFLGYSVEVVPQDSPPAVDWMSPFKPLTYDIDHSDGFAVIDSQLRVRFVNGAAPAFIGTLSKTLAHFMRSSTNVYTSPVYKDGWTPAQALAAIDWVTQKRY